MERDASRRQHPNPVSLSVAPCVVALGGSGYRLDDNLRLMEWALRETAAEGCEFQNLAEWDHRTPPLDEGAHRLKAWTHAEKHTADEIAQRIVSADTCVLSIHANRDVGVNLCSRRNDQIERGRSLIEESLGLAQAVGAEICVFHLWDTWRKSFDVRFLESSLRRAAAAFPEVKASVENVPTHLEGETPFTLADRFEWITLDLHWAALFDEFQRFRACVDRIANVHVRFDARLSMSNAPADMKTLEDALRILVLNWGYSGPLTFEPLEIEPGTNEELASLLSVLRFATRS